MRGSERAHSMLKTVEKLRNSFYVERCFTSLKNDRELNLFVNEAALVIAEATFDLRGCD